MANYEMCDHKVSTTNASLNGYVSVLPFVYNLFQATTASRLNRVVFRDNIAAKIAEHGRRLDTIIIAF